MKTKLMIGLLSVLVLAGCTGMNQDPLKDASDAVKNAVDSNTKIDREHALPSGSYTLLQPEKTIRFNVGKMSSFNVQLKTYLPDYDFTLSVANLADFPGANFSGGIFSWNPPSSAISASKNFDQFDVVVKIQAKNKFSGAVLTSQDKIPFYIESDFTALPSVKNVKFSAFGNPLMFEEGTKRDMTIFAEDIDGQDLPGERPTLVFSGRLANYFVVQSTRFLASQNQWEFEVSADLATADVTKNMEAAPLFVQVSNRLNKTSVPYKVDFTVLSALGAPAATFDNTTVFALNKPNSVVFSIYDVQGESVPTLAYTYNLPAGATLSCEKTARTFQQCKFDWTPTVTGSFTTTLQTETRSSSAFDTRPAVGNNISITYRVQ